MRREWGPYHNQVNSNLTAMQWPGYRAYNCKMSHKLGFFKMIDQILIHSVLKWQTVISGIMSLGSLFILSIKNIFMSLQRQQTYIQPVGTPDKAFSFPEPIIFLIQWGLTTTNKGQL